MKEKILLAIIGILIFAIIYINFFSNKKNNNDVNQDGMVKAAQNIDYNVNFELTKNISKIPQKNIDFYEPDIWANSYILLDLGSATILTAKNENQKVAIASTTKIMTAIVALENFSKDDIVTVSQQSTEQYPTNVGLEAGEKIKVIDLLYCLLIRSGNDAAYALADHMGFDKFITKMNDKAKYLGLEDTNFKDPAGLDDSGYSTAHDLAFILAYALKNETITTIIKTPSISVNSYDRDKTYDLENSNRLILNDKSIYYDNSIGGKTGYTPDAGHCLASASQKDAHILIAIVLSTFEDTAEASAIESKKLFEWGFSNYIWK